MEMLKTWQKTQEWSPQEDENPESSLRSGEALREGDGAAAKTRASGGQGRAVQIPPDAALMLPAGAGGTQESREELVSRTTMLATSQAVMAKVAGLSHGK